jgi:hypothetical protein
LSESQDSHLQVGLDSIPKKGVPENLAFDCLVDFLSPKKVEKLTLTIKNTG